MADDTKITTGQFLGDVNSIAGDCFEGNPELTVVLMAGTGHSHVLTRSSKPSANTIYTLVGLLEQLKLDLLHAAECADDDESEEESVGPHLGTA